MLGGVRNEFESGEEYYRLLKKENIIAWVKIGLSALV
jgi:hypothetical protein